MINAMSNNPLLTRGQLISLFFIALLIFIVFNVFFILSPFFIPIFWAAVVAFGFYPAHLRIKKTFKGHENGAAFFTTFLIFLIFVPLVIWLFLSVAEQGLKLYRWFIEFVQDGRLELLLNDLRSIPFIRRVENLLHRFEILNDGSEEWLTRQASALAEYAGYQTGVLTKNIFLFFVYCVLTFFLVFFFFRDGEKLVGFIHEITPLEDENKKEIFRQLDDTFNAVLRGQLVTALVQAVIAGIAFWTLGLPAPAFFAALTFFVALIPIFGAATVWFPFVVYLLLLGQYGKAAALFLVGALIISLVDNVLKPILIGEKTKLPYFLLFLGILGGLQAYGFMGLFLAPAVLSVFFVLIKIYRKKFLD